jgi:hypothetical protein
MVVFENRGWSRESTEEEEKLFERLADLRQRGIPVECSDPDCPATQPGAKVYRGLPPFLQNKKSACETESIVR